MGKKGINRKYNWEQALQFFVEGMPVDEDEPDGDRDWPNLRVLSERMDIPYQRMRERASQERWTEQRQAYQITAAKDRQKQRMRKMGDQAIEFDEKSLDIAKMGMQLVGVRMSEIAKLVNASKKRRDEAVERLANGEAVDRTELWSQVRSDEIVALAKAAETLQDIGRKSLGTDVHNINIEHDVSVGATINVTAELERDDPDRLAGFLAAADRTGLLDVLLELEGPDSEDDEVVEADIVEEGD